MDFQILSVVQKPYLILERFCFQSSLFLDTNHLSGVSEHENDCSNTPNDSIISLLYKHPAREPWAWTDDFRINSWNMIQKMSVCILLESFFPHQENMLECFLVLRRFKVL